MHEVIALYIGLFSRWLNINIPVFLIKSYCPLYRAIFTQRGIGNIRFSGNSYSKLLPSISGYFHSWSAVASIANECMAESYCPLYRAIFTIRRKYSLDSWNFWELLPSISGYLHLHIMKAHNVVRNITCYCPLYRAIFTF